MSRFEHSAPGRDVHGAALQAQPLAEKPEGIAQELDNPQREGMDGYAGGGPNGKYGLKEFVAQQKCRAALRSSYRLLGMGRVCVCNQLN